MLELFNDVDDFMHGNPEDKFFDIVFNANNDVVRFEMAKVFKEFVAMQSLLEETFGDDLESKIQEKILVDSEEISARVTNIYMAKMGDILSQSE
jgi:hypothetical protein